MILTRNLFHNNQRYDLEDFNAQLAAARSDAHFFIQRFYSDQAYILQGFTISSSFIGQATADVSLTSATLINGDNSGDVSWWTAENTPDPITLPTGVGGLLSGRNYVELQIYAEDGTPLQRAFWDPSANSGEGEEFTQEVDTVTEMRVRVVINQTGFTTDDSSLIALAIIDLDGDGNIQGIRDRRELFYRLASSTDVDAEFTWSSRTAPATTLVFETAAGTAFTVDETVTFTSGATATVSVAGTNNIQVFDFSNDNLQPGDTVTGSTSGATATLQSYCESFTGADKDIHDMRDMLAALMNEIRVVKGTRFWHEIGDAASLMTLLNYVNALITPVSAGARLGWSGTTLTITDSAVSGQTSADALGAVRIPGYSGDVYLCRQDGTGGSATITIPDGSLLYVELPTAGSSRSFSGAGSGTTNYRVVTRAEFNPSDSNFVLAYREGSKLIVKGMGEMDSGEERQIGDEVSGDLLSYIGVANETTAEPTYASTDVVTQSASLTTAVGELDAAAGNLITYTGSTGEDDSAPAYSSEVFVTSGDSLTTAVGDLDAALDVVDTAVDVLYDINEREKQLILAEHATDSDKVTISAADSVQLDASTLSQELDSRILDFSGAVIDFTTGNIFESDGTTALGTDFTPFTVPEGHYFWYGVSLSSNVVDALNKVVGVVQITPAETSNPASASAPLAAIQGSKKVGVVQVYNNAGSIEVVAIRRLGKGSGSGSSSPNVVNVDWHQADASVTTLPSNAPTYPGGPEVDGGNVSLNEVVLFSALSSDNNTVHKLVTSDFDAASLDTWTTVAAPEAYSWSSIAWSPQLNLFVAVGLSGTDTERVMTSPDGITWTIRLAAEAAQWNCVIWVAELELFVAVSPNATNQVMTSPDGITWTSQSASEASTWKSVTWSPELALLVAVANSGTNRVMTSPDGITWTSQTVTTDLWVSITWAPSLSLFAAVGSGTNRVMTSPDGVTWTMRTEPENNTWASVAWSDELGLFAAVSVDGTSRVITSPDGITWTGRTAAEDNNWQEVIWAEELHVFVAVAADGTNRVMTSEDGITWVSRPATADETWSGIVWAKEVNKLVAVGSVVTDGIMYVSPQNTITWIQQNPFEINGAVSSTATSEQQIRVTNGDAYGGQLGVFYDTAFKFNETVKYSKSGNYWEQRALEVATLANNASTALETIESNGQDSYVINYSIIRDSAKEVGTAIINILGSDVDVVSTASSIGVCGFGFSAAVVAGNVEISGVLDASSAIDGELKYIIKRW